MSQIHPPSLQPQQSPPNLAAQLLGSHRAPNGANENELPPSARARRDRGGNPSPNQPSRRQERSRRLPRALALVAAAVLGLAAWSWNQGESSHRNWSHHQQATTRWEDAQKDASLDPQPMKWVSEMGPAMFTDIVPIGIDDLDEDTTESIRTSLYQGNRDEAERTLCEAQQDLADPVAAYETLAEPPAEAPATPSISSGMHRAILSGDTQFFHIYLYDSCDEDGDIVDLEINGCRFATVPITHGGTTLTVPFSVNTPTTVVIRGIWDGGGGITVACRTSQGQGFIRVMQPGEEQILAVVGR